MAKTNEQIEALKINWSKDPCWDIEDTEGFEDHHGELLAWRLDLEEKYRLADNARAELRRKMIKKVTGTSDDEIADSLFTFSEIESLVARQDMYIGDSNTKGEIVKLELMQSQIRATLLLATQLKRVADAFEEANNNHDAEDNRDFMTRLYKVD